MQYFIGLPLGRLGFLLQGPSHRIGYHAIQEQAIYMLIGSKYTAQKRLPMMFFNWHHAGLSNHPAAYSYLGPFEICKRVGLCKAGAADVWARSVLPRSDLGFGVATRVYMAQSLEFSACRDWATCIGA